MRCSKLCIRDVNPILKVTVERPKLKTKIKTKIIVTYRAPRTCMSAVCHVRYLSRNLVSAVCHVHCLSQKFQKIMSRVRCLSWLLYNPRVNCLSRFCHRFVTFLWRLYIRNSFQFVSRLQKQHEGVHGRGHELNQNRDTNMDTDTNKNRDTDMDTDTNKNPNRDGDKDTYTNTNKNRDTAIVKKSSIIWSA